MREPLKKLISSIPHGSEDLAVGGDNVRILRDLPDGYIWPDLVRDSESGNGPSPIVLITAPGAMGKSAAAQAIGASTKMPYLDLARVRVGSGSLTGELAKALGFKAMGQFVEDLKAGRASIILDSSDEAQLASGRENYLAFLRDLAWLLMDAAPNNQVVMLGRRDATETTLLALMELGLTPPLYQVAPLSQSQASDLISLTLDRKITSSGTFYTVHRRHPQPFAELRDALFADLARALEPDVDIEAGYWDRVADFLGYPPVVTALAERLAVDNPAAALEELLATPRSDKPVLRGVLLRTVLEHIMQRESTKVRDRVGEALAIRESDPERLTFYDTDEQAARLLKLTGTAGVSIEQPAVLAEHERARYEDLIESFVADHPFVSSGAFANVVFSDYIRAWSISSTIGALYTVSRTEFFASLPKTGPFFAHFLHALSMDATEFGAIPEDIVDDAIHSFALGAESGHAIYVHQKEDAVLLLHDNEEVRDGVPAGLGFIVQELSGVLVLSSPLARILCVTENGVVLRGTSGNLDFGPEVSIVAEAVSIEADTVTALGDKRNEVSTLNMITAQTVEHPGDIRVSAVPPTALAISWENAWHQWKPYAKDFAFHRPVPNSVATQVLLCLRRVLTSFKSSVRDSPSVSADKMDRVLVGTNPIFIATLSALVRMQLVVREGNIYRVNLEALATYGVSWTNLRGDDPVDSLRTVLAAVISQPELEKFLTA